MPLLVHFRCFSDVCVFVHVLLIQPPAAGCVHTECLCVCVCVEKIVLFLLFIV